MSDQRENRNQVFTGTQQSNQTYQSTPQPQTNQQRSSIDELPTETVPLPSRGKVYPQGHPLHGADFVEIKSMTAREEDILTNTALIKRGTVVSELIRSCLVNKDINPTDLLLGDRWALSVAIRITGYGQDYPTFITCPDCQSKVENTFNLAELPIRPLELDPIIPGANVFEFVLPYSKKLVKYQYATGKTEEDTLLIAENKKKAGIKVETNVTTFLQNSILSVDNVEDKNKIANFIRNMPARDSIALRTHISDTEPSVIMKQQMICNACGASQEVDVPFGVSFFWPSAKR